MKPLRPKWIGAQVGSGSHDEGTRRAPQYLSPHIPFHRIVSEKPSGAGIDAHRGLVEFNNELAHDTFLSCMRRQFPIVLGGDHSCAMGTWSGISHFEGGPLGLLWIDAHMDAHTFETTETGNIHGMPLASLLGHGHKDFTQILNKSPKVDPAHTVLFGVRSFEAGEQALLRSLKVRVYSMEEIQKRGFIPCWREALMRVSQNRFGFGISLDLDALDPKQIPSVGTPVDGGLLKADMHWALHKSLSHPKLCGLEIVEFNPNHDIDNQGLNFVLEVCALAADRLNQKAPAQIWPVPKPVAEYPWAL